MNPFVKKVLFYFALGGGAAYAIMTVVGNELGYEGLAFLLACMSNLALMHILFRQGDQEGEAQNG